MVAMSWVSHLHFHDFFRFRFLQRVDAVLAGHRSPICNPNGVSSVRAKPPVFGQIELLSFAGHVADGVFIVEFRAVTVEVV